jgi:hypothetical protein
VPDTNIARRRASLDVLVPVLIGVSAGRSLTHALVHSYQPAMIVTERTGAISTGRRVTRHIDRPIFGPPLGEFASERCWT